MARLILAACLACAAAFNAVAADHAVILVYHRVADDGPASTRISPAQFERHLDWLADNGFVVLPLTRVLDDLYSRGETQDNAVVLTFDDAYASIDRTAFPMLRERDMPFSIFVATEAADNGFGHYLDWAQLIEMQASGLVEIGPHSLTHAHLEHRRDGESAGDWALRVSAEIEGSLERLRERLPQAPIEVFAFPYGEYNTATLDRLQALGLRGLAQQSGALGARSPAGRIPRFPMATGYDSLERLATAVRSRPLPVKSEQALPFFLDVGASHPASLTLTLEGDDPAPGAVNCFSATGGALDTTTRGNDLVVSLPPLVAGRNKINCTAPTGRAGEFFWYSRLWTVADAAGRWLEE